MTTPTANELDARVAKGAALLDEKDPGWLDVIDIDRLDVHSTVDCVAGQLFSAGTDPDGAFCNTMYRLGLDTADGATAYGFQLRVWEVHWRAEELGINATGAQIYAPLTDAWKRLITARRAAS